MKPSSYKVTIPLKELIEGMGLPPAPQRRILSICFAAPGYRHAQVELRR